MSERVTAGSPLEIDRVERARGQGGSVQLRLRGRWLDPGAVTEEELLVVQIEGRRHRFPGTRAESEGEGGSVVAAAGDGSAAESWDATFTVPDWAEPRHEGQAALWLGSAVIPVPPPGWSAPSNVPAGESASSEEPEAAPPPELAPTPTVEEILADPAADTPRSGPLADLLLKETVAALHAELEQRTAEAVRLRGALADAQSELEARTAGAGTLEATQQQLRAELERLTGAVAQQRRDGKAQEAELERERAEAAAARATAQRRAAENARLREELAAAQVARDAAAGEVAGLRAELERIGAELAATRERVGAEAGDLGEAHRLLADARALAEELRGG